MILAILIFWKKTKNFIKDIIKKQLKLSYISVAAFPNDGVLKNHLNIMKHVQDSNFQKLLAGRVNAPVTVQQFAEIFTKLLNEQLDILLTTLFVLIFTRTNFCAFAQTNPFESKN